MGAVPTTTNKTLGTAESIINGGVMKVIAPVVTQLISSVPQLSFLKIWPLSAILSFVVNWIFGFANTALQVLGVKLIISIQTDAEKKAYSEAEGALRLALQSGDLNAIAKAKADSDKAMESLVHWDGSSTIIS